MNPDPLLSAVPSRREFLAGAAGAALALPASRILGANERIGVGLIGCGGQGTNHLSRLARNPAVHVVGVCDVYEPRLENAAAISKATPYHDWRELLARDDLDAVWIATPDHWHASMAIAAMEAGKDLYCEKPMARTWKEARDFRRAAIRTERVVQVGSQDTSRPLWWKARDLVRAGELGKLVWSQTSYSRCLRDGDWKYGVDLDATRKTLDWDAFLGPAPWRPYDPERFFRWRKYWDYSGGIATDLFVHVLHSLCLALDNPTPKRVVSGGGVYVHRDRETPDTFLTVIDYEGDQSVLVVGSQANEQGLPVVVRGHEATMHLSGNDITIRPERPFGATRKEAIVKTEDVGDTIDAHHANFLDCVRRRDARTNCNVELAYRVHLAVDMAVDSYRKSAAMRYDPAKEEVLDA